MVQKKSDQLVELPVKYDAYNQSGTPCYITSPNQNRTCIVKFIIPSDLEPPVLVHYEVEQFYQNHRRYIKSRDDVQVSNAVF